MNILSPDKNTLLIKYYHTFNKAIVPTILCSYLNHRYQINSSMVDVLTTLNLGFHSYISTSAIISDYIKHQKISNVMRVSSMNLHLISTLGIVRYIVV